MKKYLITLSIVLLYLSKSYAQVGLVAPDLLVCPGESVSYGSSPVSTNNQGCTYSWTVTNGVFSNGQTTFSGTGNAGLDVTVIWNNVQATSNTVAPKGKLEITVSGCSLPTGEKKNDVENNIVIKTLNNVTPDDITGDDEVAANITTAKTYSVAKVKFPNTGVTSGYTSSVYADSYQWIIPVGWKLDGVTSNGSTPITGKGESVSLVPDAFSQGVIKVRAYSNCNNGYTSNWVLDFPVSRTVATPSTITHNNGNNFVVCGDTSPIAFQVAAVAGATSYTWTKPSGWGGTSTSNSITLTPNGTNAGTITVKAKSGSYTSAASSSTLGIELYDPNNPPTISGSPIVCTTNRTYTINNPTGTSVVWSVSPANLFAVDIGSGSSFTTRATNGFVSGNGTITAIVSGACGSSPPITRNIYVGTPISSSEIDSNILTDGDNSIKVELMGANDERLQWGVNGVIVNDNGSSWWVSIYFNDYPCVDNQVTLSMRKNGVCGWSNWVSINYTECMGEDFFQFSTNPMKSGSPANKVIISDRNYDKNIDYTIFIFNKYGNKVYSQTHKNKEFNIILLQEGLYIVRIHAKDGTSIAKTLIIE